MTPTRTLRGKPVPALLVLLLGACSSDTAGKDSTDATPDSGSGAGDVTAPDADDVTPDVPEEDVETDTDGGSADVAADTALPDTSEIDVEPVDAEPEDVEPQDGSADVVESDGSADAADTDVDTGPVIPPLLDCAEDPTLCELPYSCIAGTCRLPLAGRTMCEDLDDFEIAQPEELTEVFFLIKTLAVDARFLALEPGFGDDPALVPAVYGAADVVDDSDAPIAIRWQSFFQEPVDFVPSETDPRAWVSLPWDYNLDAVVTFTFPGFGTQTARVGFLTEDVRLELVLDEDGLTASAVLEGYLTREEAEDRFMISVEEAGSAFALLLCSEDTSYVPADGVWHFADLFDCNGAPLDSDRDPEIEGNDAYFIRMEIQFVSATLVGF